MTSIPTAFGSRPRRSAHQAMDAITEGLLKGYTRVIDADLSCYFDTIPHDKLLRSVAGRVADGAALGLLRRGVIPGAATEKMVSYNSRAIMAPAEVLGGVRLFAAALQSSWR